MLKFCETDYIQQENTKAHLRMSASSKQAQGRATSTR